MEKITNTEINSSEILKEIDNLKFDDYEQFVCGGIKFLIILVDETDENDNHSKAVFSTSTAIDGFDIYLYRKLSNFEMKRLVFHEVFEAILVNRGLDNSIAHKHAQESELKVFGKNDKI